jgi:hypothetical protein
MMAELSIADRRRILAALMRHWSNDYTPVGLTKANLKAAVDATDTWIDDNQTSYNQALPQKAQDNLTAAQKTLLFCGVALMRVDPGVAAYLARALQTEVD